MSIKNNKIHKYINIIRRKLGMWRDIHTLKLERYVAKNLLLPLTFKYSQDIKKHIVWNWHILPEISFSSFEIFYTWHCINDAYVQTKSARQAIFVCFAQTWKSNLMFPVETLWKVERCWIYYSDTNAFPESFCHVDGPICLLVCAGLPGGTRKRILIKSKSFSRQRMTMWRTWVNLIYEPKNKIRRYILTLAISECLSNMFPSSCQELSWLRMSRDIWTKEQDTTLYSNSCYFRMLVKYVSFFMSGVILNASVARWYPWNWSTANMVHFPRTIKSRRW